MKGYWNRPDSTAEAIVDGWLATGDIAEIDTEGYIRIVDRKKDMIIVSGFNVYPNEIEDVISAHPDVIECAAIGVPSESTGEAVKVFVVTKNTNLTADELKTFCRRSLTAYELPKSNVGKILRKDLRDEEKLQRDKTPV